jgi:uncharacterized membrane protein YdjX (TVP38/TMEM64 family)
MMLKSMKIKNSYFHKFKNTIFLFLSFVVFFYFITTETGRYVINDFSLLGLLGSFLAGIFLVSTFTVLPSIIVLLKIAEVYDPVSVALTAGLGSVVGDYAMFSFLRDHVYDELLSLIPESKRRIFSRLSRSKYLAWMTPVLGALIVASPLPDEIGIGLMGMSRLKGWQFILISFFLNTIGTYMLISFMHII